MNRIEMAMSAALPLLHRRRCLAAVVSPPSSRHRRLAAVVSPPSSCRLGPAAVVAVIVAVDVASYQFGIILLDDWLLPVGGPHCNSTSSWGEQMQSRAHTALSELSSPQRADRDVRELTTFHYRLTLLCRVRLPLGPSPPWPSSFSRKTISSPQSQYRKAICLRSRLAD